MTWRVTAAHRPPFVFYQKGPTGDRFSGMLLDLLPLLFQYGGVNDSSYAIHNAPINSGGRLVNGSWTGLIGELMSDQADIALFPLTLTSDRPGVIDMTYSYYDGGIGLIVQSENVGTDTLAFLNPFSFELWLALVATVVGVWLLMTLIAWISPLGECDVKKLRRLDEGGGRADHTWQEYVVDTESDSVLLQTWMVMMNQAPTPGGRSWAPRILYLTLMFFSLIITSSYTAQLAAFLTVNQLSLPIQSLVDLLKSGKDYIVNPNGSTFAYFQDSLDPVANMLKNQLKVLPDSDAGVAAVRNGTAVAYLTDVPTLQYYAGLQPCDLTVVGTPFGPGNLCVGLQKGSPLLEPFNSAMLILRENGIIDNLRRRWFTDLDQCTVSNASSGVQIGINNVAGLFYMLLLFSGVAVLWACGERLLMYGMKKNATLRKWVQWLEGHTYKNSRKNIDFTRSVSGRIVSKLKRSDAITRRRLTQEYAISPGTANQYPFSSLMGKTSSDLVDLESQASMTSETSSIGKPFRRPNLGPNGSLPDPQKSGELQMQPMVSPFLSSPKSRLSRDPMQISEEQEEKGGEGLNGNPEQNLEGVVDGEDECNADGHGVLGEESHPEGGEGVRNLGGNSTPRNRDSGDVTVGIKRQNSCLKKSNTPPRLPNGNVSFRDRQGEGDGRTRGNIAAASF